MSLSQHSDQLSDPNDEQQELFLQGYSRHEAEHSHPQLQMHGAITPLYICMTCCSIKHRDNLTFYCNDTLSTAPGYPSLICHIHLLHPSVTALQ